MTVNIQLHYRTSWGEGVQLRLGKRRIPMEYSFGDLWQIMLTGRDIHSGDPFTFEVVRDGKVVQREWRHHVFTAPVSQKNIIIRSYWKARPANSAFYASAFSDVIFRRPDGCSFRHPRHEGPSLGNVCFRIAAPEVRSNESVGIVGSGKVLGNWNKVHLMTDAQFPWWFLTMDIDEPMEYKYVIADTKTKQIRCWEEGPNHFFAEVPPKDTQLIVSDIQPKFPTEPWRGAGVAVPVFSLRTEDSFGVGEFHDLKKLVDWAVKAGQNVIQILPINDTTMTHAWQDSYPYNAVSSFALHPQFVHLPDAGVRKDAAYKAKQAQLEALPQEDYEQVNSIKLEMLRKLFMGAKGKQVVASPEYQAFVEANKEWLLPYAVFSVLRDQHGTPEFEKWGKYATYSAKKADDVAKANPEEVGFYCYVQYLLDVQLKDAINYAHLHGVALKGDLPIGVSRQSVDAWQHPNLFHMDSQAGAPPDAFAEDGQNWGFPTYNWEEMEKDGYAWWKARMGKMAEYFDAFRIDHILGFFRIWEIPSQYKSGLMGHFNPALPYSEDELRMRGFNPREGEGTDVLFVEDPRKPGYWHPRISGEKTSRFAALSEDMKRRYIDLYTDFFWFRHNDFWKECAMRKLPALLRSTGMLSCGEDLGMIPGCVPSVMEDLNILSLEIQRMPKNPADAFARPDQYPYWCVCATGTHDTSPLRAWWEEDRALTQQYYNQMLGCEGDAPYFCEPWVADLILAQHMKSPAMLAILPLQDYLATDGDIRYQGNPADERINVPAIPRYYWRYRMHCTLESLIANDKFNGHIRTLVEAASRNR
ncbi:MAG: 4-alpha-glucanotransferase [Bacteroidales bacterium]|nr:4-alpha-glucanotransferase [Bacteroidales bacterium]